VITGACASGFEDCDGVVSNGCEVDLSGPTSCGNCTTVCTDPTPDCVSTGGVFACGVAPEGGVDAGMDSGSDAGSDGAADAGTCHLVVNELQAGGATATDEWVEIFNPCTTATDLTGWTLNYRSAGNNAGGADIHLLSLTGMIPAGAYRLYTGAGFTGTAMIDGTWTTGGLAAGGGAVGLRDMGGALIDSVAYSTLTTTNNFTETAPAPNPTTNHSIARHPDGSDMNDNSMDFVLRTTPTPRAANP
jgi:hypothetical protein